jgi:hypothetical protein
MKGQWIGNFQGSVGGMLMVNIDEVEDHFEVVAHINPSDGNIPSSVAYISTGNNLPEQEADAFINPVDPRTGFQCKWDDIKELYGKGVSHSESAKVTLKIRDDKLHIDAVSDIGVTLSSVLVKPLEKAESKIQGTKMSWDEFKRHISGMSKSKYLFRGQKEPWRLRTSFHRHGRYRISEFTNKDVKRLHQRLSAITSHYFDLSDPEQNGSFFNLLQHHGYPTPLLDWSYSPYVSAFFAFRDWPIRYSGEGNARIYIFDNVAWQKRYPQIPNLNPQHPHLSVMEFIAIDNPRLVPQQSVTTTTNIDDIEAYLLERECSDAGSQYLRAIDIPARERSEAMTELRFMGITAASMFPGIDGVCEEFRERNFDE